MLFSAGKCWHGDDLTPVTHVTVRVKPLAGKHRGFQDEFLVDTSPWKIPELQLIPRRNHSAGSMPSP